jgi:hypothetical protein
MSEPIRLFVRGLPDVGVTQLKARFSSFGVVKQVDIIKDSNGMRSSIYSLLNISVILAAFL